MIGCFRICMFGLLLLALESNASLIKVLPNKSAKIYMECSLNEEDAQDGKKKKKKMKDDKKSNDVVKTTSKSGNYSRPMTPMMSAMPTIPTGGGMLLNLVQRRAM